MADDPPSTHPAKRKKKIPKALREAVWVKHVGRHFEHKCLTPWCLNTMTVFDFQTGHNIPESRGGATTIENLVPICSRCNLSMSNTHTIEEWSTRYGATKRPGFLGRIWRRFVNPCRATTVAPGPGARPSTPSKPSKSVPDKSPASQASREGRP